MATSAEVRAEVKGLEETQRKLEQVLEDLDGTPMVLAMRTATLMVQRDAKIVPPMPVDTGRLRASIWPTVATMGEVIEGVVGSNVTYAPYQELGTKHMKGKRFLQRAFDKNKERIYRMFEQTAQRIVNK